VGWSIRHCAGDVDSRSCRPPSGLRTAAAGAAAFLGFFQALQHFAGDGNAFLGVARGLGGLGFVDVLGDGFVQALGGGAGSGHAVVDLLQVGGAKVFGGEHRRSQQGGGRLGFDAGSETLGACRVGNRTRKSTVATFIVANDENYGAEFKLAA